MSAKEYHWTCKIELPFPTERTALIAFNTLVADEEPRKSDVQKRLEVTGATLLVHLAATEARLLRMAFHSFMTFLSLTLQTMEMFPDNLEGAC